MDLIGYHGTSKNSCCQILTTGVFHKSTGPDQWLGDGVYFFQDDKHQAYMFYKYKNGMPPENHENICVISAHIQSPDEEVIDLTTDAGRLLVDQFERRLAEKHPEYTINDTVLLNMLYQDIRYNLVRAIYLVPKGDKRKGDHRYEIAQTQICVKNLDCLDQDSFEEVCCDDFK